MLKDDSVFTTGKEARELLFTGNFLELMLKEANQDETLAKRDLAVAATTRGRRNPFRSTRRGSQSHPPVSPNFSSINRASVAEDVAGEPCRIIGDPAVVVGQAEGTSYLPFLSLYPPYVMQRMSKLALDCGILQRIGLWYRRTPGF